MSEQRITYPFGWLAGHEGNVPDVIAALALEMLGNRSDLQERAGRVSFPPEKNLTEQAELLEKYAVILNVVFVQMRPDTWNPNAMSGLIELAAKHGVTLPEWMTKQEGQTGES